MEDLEVREREKYLKAWDHDDYRIVAPGERLFVPFVQTVQPKKNPSLYDYGAGTGRAADCR